MLEGHVSEMAVIWLQLHLWNVPVSDCHYWARVLSLGDLVPHAGIMMLINTARSFQKKFKCGVARSCRAWLSSQQAGGPGAHGNSQLQREVRTGGAQKRRRRQRGREEKYVSYLTST